VRSLRLYLAALLSLFTIPLLAWTMLQHGDTSRRQAVSKEIAHAEALIFGHRFEGGEWWFAAGDPAPPRVEGAGYAAERDSRRAWWAAQAIEGRGVATIDGERFMVQATVQGARVIRWRALSRDVAREAGVSLYVGPPGESRWPALTAALTEGPELNANPGEFDLPFLIDGVIAALLGLPLLFVLLELFLLQLTRTQEKAEAATRAALLARISHELRTPAAAVRSLLDALAIEGAVPAGERPQYLGLISDEAGRLSEGVERLLHAARGGGSRPLAKARVDLVAWAEAAAARWSTRLDGLTLDAPGALLIEADPDRLDEAIDALLDNARKYGAAPVALTLRATRGGARLVVEDAGPGVPRRHRRAIFDRLARVEGRPGDPGGFGLGLWAAREVARAHGGDLRLEGTNRFALTLPG